MRRWIRKGNVWTYEQVPLVVVYFVVCLTGIVLVLFVGTME